jgi:hypothetical protein
MNWTLYIILSSSALLSFMLLVFLIGKTKEGPKWNPATTTVLDLLILLALVIIPGINALWLIITLALNIFCIVEITTEMYERLDYTGPGRTKLKAKIYKVLRYTPFK